MGPATPTGSGTYSFPELEIFNPHEAEGRLIKSITVQFTTAVASGDSITLPAGSGFTALSGSKAVNRTLVHSTGATAEQWQAYLRSHLRVTLAGFATKGLRVMASFTVPDGVYDYNSANGHYYRAFSSRTTWKNAFAAASATSYMGMQGYLVTVTSQQENDFVTSLVAMNTWMGATCDNDYGRQYNGGRNSYTNWTDQTGRYIHTGTFLI